MIEFLNPCLLFFFFVNVSKEMKINTGSGIEINICATPHATSFFVNLCMIKFE